MVEDEQAVRDLTVKMLQKLGYRILTAASGAEAIEISRAHPARSRCCSPTWSCPA